MTPSNEKAAGGGAVELQTVAFEAGDELYRYEDGIPFRLLPPAGEVAQLVRRTDAESALKLQAQRIAELEGALRRLMKSLPTDSDMAAAGWDGSEINEAHDAHEAARAALSKTA